MSFDIFFSVVKKLLKVSNDALNQIVKNSFSLHDNAIAAVDVLTDTSNVIKSSTFQLLHVPIYYVK